MQVYDIIAELPAHPTRKYRRRALRDIRRIVLHHSATDTGTPEAFARYHVQSQGWPGIAYHYVIMRDGTAYKTQEASVMSYHAAGANKDGLGICMVGNFDRYDPPLAQLRACLELCIDLCRAYNIPVAGVIGHREVPGTMKTCPGKRIDMHEFRRLLKERMEAGS